MGIFCIVLGIIIPVLFALIGHAAGCLMFIGENTNIILGSEPFNINALLQFPEPDKMLKYIVVVAACVVFGMLIGAGPFFCGISYRKLSRRADRLERMIRKTARRSGREG